MFGHLCKCNHLPKMNQHLCPQFKVFVYLPTTAMKHPGPVLRSKSPPQFSLSTYYLVLHRKTTHTSMTYLDQKRHRKKLLLILKLRMIWHRWTKPQWRGAKHPTGAQHNGWHRTSHYLILQITWVIHQNGLELTSSYTWQICNSRVLGIYGWNVYSVVKLRDLGCI